MMVLGLTGSIAMGKSTVAGMFRDLGVPVHDADAAVHRLLEPGGAGAGPVGGAFPECVADGAIDRQALGRSVFGDPERRRRLEGILHPLVRADRDRWLEDRRAEGAAAVVLDIPLLFETGAERDCDRVVLVYASRETQRRRALARPGMTEDKLRGIVAAQMDDAEKLRRAYYRIPTDRGIGDSRRRVGWIMDEIAGQAAGMARDERSPGA